MKKILHTLILILFSAKVYSSPAVQWSCKGTTSSNQLISFDYVLSDFSHGSGYQNQMLENVLVDNVKVDDIDLQSRNKNLCRSLGYNSKTIREKHYFSMDEFNYEVTCSGQESAGFHAICKRFGQEALSDNDYACYEPYIPMKLFKKIDKWNQLFLNESDNRIIEGAQSFAHKFGVPMVVLGQAKYSRFNVDSDTWEQIQFVKSLPRNFEKMVPKIEVFEDSLFSRKIRTVAALNGSYWKNEVLVAMADFENGSVYFEHLLKPLSPLCRQSSKKVLASLMLYSNPDRKAYYGHMFGKVFITEPVQSNLNKKEVPCPSSYESGFAKCYMFSSSNHENGLFSPIYTLFKRYQ